MIDYERLGKAVDYYRSHGFQCIEAPWAVSYKAVDLTCPPDGKYYELKENTGRNKGYLVASAEQSFLHMILDDALPKGRFQAITPCFRGDHIDLLHHRWFMKLELIHYLGDVDPIEYTADELLKAAAGFFSQYLTVLAMPTEPGRTLDVPPSTFDLCEESTMIELGSYGVRHHPVIGTWIYGTGLAEPRLSQVIEMKNNVI